MQSLEDQHTACLSEQKSLVEDLRKHFQMPPDSSVISFLEEHRSIPPVLIEAKEHLNNCFGSNTIFSLRAELDESGSRTLYVTAVWPGTVKDAKEALDKFDASWWLTRASQTGGYLTFTYELV